MQNEYKGHTLFNDINNVDLQTYNRCQMFLNLSVNQGAEFARGYVELLDNTARQLMKDMYVKIRTLGVEAVKKEIIKAI